MDSFQLHFFKMKNGVPLLILSSSILHGVTHRPRKLPYAVTPLAHLTQCCYLSRASGGISSYSDLRIP